MGNQGVILSRNKDISLLHSAQTGCEVQVASLNWGLSPQEQINQVMKLSTNFQLVLKLMSNRAISSFTFVFTASCLMKDNTLSSVY
jgi:hypothetical protein